MKVTFAMIVYNTDFVLRQALDSIIPYGPVVVAEGPVKHFWNDPHRDETIQILESYDMVKKVYGKWEEKTQQCQAFMPLIDEDTDYVWCIDADEVFTPETIERVFRLLSQKRPASVGFSSKTFYGGFDHVMDGFEARHNFKRVLRYTPGCQYVNHRPPTIEPETGEHFKRFETMYHYSYVSPIQVKRKIEYYEKNIIKKGDCKKDYFEKVFLRWQKEPGLTELHNHGVHEFVSAHSYTKKFTGSHPKVIQDAMPELLEKLKKQYAHFT